MRRGPEWRYPERTRCYRCGRYFGFLVVEGLYDSYECAGKPDPADVPAEQWPRQHFARTPSGARRPKRVWLTRAEAERAAARFGKQAYVCEFCNEWHIGGKHMTVRITDPKGNLIEVKNLPNGGKLIEMTSPAGLGELRLDAESARLVGEALLPAPVDAE